MTAPARLLALRLQGFKSFADRTLVEFGGGISAVVGPNGSGKSNLADALRWSLGEQGRALRSRKSEDVIFAGSDRRAALGMADVTLVLDNADGLLPVEYSVLELGRRLYRSGENDYLLNRQRVRLRDLVDLLDAAHLADNAFLFIGQGMVDQALALRPEERRPLFEEVAGVRRHERRRRKAEDQLVESEANLARVEDILAELRPQARRLAAQAEQQATRQTAGEDLADALIVGGHARWHEVAARAADAAARRERQRADADRAMAELAAAEEQAASIASEMAEQADAERARREAHESARAASTAIQLREARLVADLESLGRDRDRLAGERATGEADLAGQRRLLAQPLPPRDLDLQAAVDDAERALAEALAELGALRSRRQAEGEAAAAARRADAVRAAEAETARQHLAEAERRAAEEDDRTAATIATRAARENDLAAARTDLEAAFDRERAAASEREAARAALDEAEGDAQASAERAAAERSRLAALRGRLEPVEARMAEEESRGIARAAKRVGGRRVDDLVVAEPRLRAAVDAALDEAARAYLVDRAMAPELATERGMLVISERASERGGSAGAAERRFGDRLAEVGGSMLVAALRRDPLGAATRLLSRTAVVPDLPAALAIQADLPSGWSVVVRDGSAVVTELAVRLGRGEAPLERRAEAERLRTDTEQAAENAAAADQDAAERAMAAATARVRIDEARAAEAGAAGERRAAEERERLAARDVEAIVREVGWHEAQAERRAAELSRLRQAVIGEPAVGGHGERTNVPGKPTAGGNAIEETEAIAAWETRAAELRTTRDRLTSDQADRDAARRAAESQRARAEAALSFAEERIARAARDAEALGEREQAVSAERESLAAQTGLATRREEEARNALAELLTTEAEARDRLAQSERAAMTARERLRAADDRLRAADRDDLEARLGRDSLREQLIVELAGLGELGLRRLETETGRPGSPTAPGAALPDGESEAMEADDETVALEAALDAAAERWATSDPPAPSPGQGRLAALRRRYHELGAANPFAVDEYAAVRQRLETLEGQQSDLRQAIGRTRELIAELNVMIADQFRTTFRALESAFDGRFQQLFGGGFARLSLTDPADLSTTGIEIVARPPGKKAQALAMLSGGERALTAVALLFAMLEVRPVPFCVLDEVDAALDEANVGRFTSALRELAARTQFVVITHNRGTIEAADALYGVTVGDDSVSRVISLRLDEAQAIADRQRDVALADVS